MKEKIKKDRRIIFYSFLSLSFFGLLMIYESSSIYALGNFSDPAYFFKRQIVFLLVSILAFFLTLLIDVGFLKKYNKEMMLVTIIGLILVVIFGKKVSGAKRWFSFGGINFQPSELLKISFLIYCADYCQRKKALLKSVRSGLFPLGIVLASICFLVILQPDLGTAVFWLMWTIIFLFLFRARIKHLIFTILCGAFVSFFLVRFHPYRLRRITSYLNPFADPKGAGFQLIQSQIAYGAGGIFGLGLGQGRQKLFFLPAAHTDFLFSIIAEEFGLIGSMGLLAVFIFIFHKMYFLAKTINDEFKSAIAWGIVFIFFLEVFINIGISCGLFPTKGLPLPFMSYGGSSLVFHYILLGLFMNVSRKEKKA